MKTRIPFLCLIVMTIFLTGCRGWKTDKTPIHPNPNLDMQAKYMPQTFSAPVPKGTVAWGRGSVYDGNPTRDDFSTDNMAFKTGESGGAYLSRNPLKVTKGLLLRGQDQYNVYCSMCHGYDGEGGGTVVQKGYHLASNLQEARYQKETYPDGKVFHVISEGFNNMWGYKKQISKEDRWAIVAYIRALQLSKRVPYSSLNADQKAKLKNGR